MSDSELLDRVQAFLDRAEKDLDGDLVLTSEKGITLLFADVQMLVALARACAEDNRREFLNAADRAVAGWKRANRNQIGIIEGLGEDVRSRNVRIQELSGQVKALAEKLDAVTDVLVRWNEMGPEIGMDPAMVTAMRRDLGKAVTN